MMLPVAFLLIGVVAVIFAFVAIALLRGASRVTRVDEPIYNPLMDDAEYSVDYAEYSAPRSQR